MSTATEKPVPVYIPWDTFTGFIGHLKATAVPSRIDKSVMPTSMPALTRGQIQSALKFLRLINDSGATTPELKALVAAYETDEWKTALQESPIFSAYSEIIGDLDVDNATQSQLDERFKGIGISGQMLVKSVRFYLAALTASGLTFSPHLIAKRKGSSPRKKGSTTKQKQTGDKPASTVDSAKPKIVDLKIPEGTRSYPLYFKGKPDGAIVVPADLTEHDCKVIELQLAVLKAYAGNGL